MNSDSYMNNESTEWKLEKEEEKQLKLIASRPNSACFIIVVQYRLIN